MTTNPKYLWLRPGWWTAVLVALIITFVWLCSALFAGSLNSYVPVTLTSARSGLVMESGAKVKMRGVQVGRVAAVEGGRDPVRLRVELFPDQVVHIPANTIAEIRATTAFGAKFIDFIYPDSPSPEHVAAGAILYSRNVTSEVNTVFQSLVAVLHQIDPAKMNAVLSALAQGVRGQGPQIGAATSELNRVLVAVNPRMATVRDDWRSLQAFSDTYGAAARNILSTLDAASTTSATVINHASDLDALLLNMIGFAESGINVLAQDRQNLVQGVNLLRPTADLLMKYNPVYTCLLTGAKWWLDHGGYEIAGGGDGHSAILDDAFLFGDDPYRYPDNLPVVAAKGGPGGKPGCGSLPDATKNYPVRGLVTNTGWGTGLDIRPNPGIGHPWWADFFPVTRAAAKPPSIRGLGRPPAIGPVPYPGAPPYGAPLYRPDGTPVYGPPSGPPQPAPSIAPQDPAP